MAVIAIQAILMSHDRCLRDPQLLWLDPEAHLPGRPHPLAAGDPETTCRHTGLRVTQTQSFGLHYAETLRRWRADFNEHWPEIADLGFDETFRRTWEFYLAYSEAGFASGYLDVAQLQLTRPDEVVA